MKIKQLALAIFSGVLLSATTFASQPKQSATTTSRFYVGIEVGGRYNDSYESERDRLVTEYGEGTAQIGQFSISVDDVVDVDEVSGAAWGWSFSGLVGYQLTDRWALQLGYIQDQKQKLSGTLGGVINEWLVSDYVVFGPEDVKLTLKSEQLYLAAKATFPLVANYKAYFMVGPAWTHLRQMAVLTETTEASGAQTDSFWSPAFALGLSARLNHRVDLNVQYMHIMADQSGSGWTELRHSFMATRRVTLGINYLFDL